MRKYFRFNITFNILWVVLLITQISVSFAQKLDDVEVVSVPLTNIFSTRLGYIVTYTSSELYNENLYIPREWFLSHAKDTTAEKTEQVYGRVSITDQNIGVPLLKITYHNNKMKYITLIIKKSSYATATSSLLPDYYDTLDLEELFNEQRGNNVLVIK